MTKPYDLIVFDWDGTLMDSTAHIVHCMQSAITKMSFPPLSDNAVRHIIGLGLHEAVADLYPDAAPDECARLAEEYLTVWRNTPHDPALFKDAMPLIELLTARGYLLAVATGKSRRGLDRMLEITQLAPVFHATRCADECFSKPHPQMLEELMTDLNTPPNRTLVIGDTQYDLNMANSAGADGLGVLTGAHDLALLQQSQPRAVLESLSQVASWLESL